MHVIPSVSEGAGRAGGAVNDHLRTARPARSLATLGMTVALVQFFLAHRYFGFLTGDEVEVLGEAFRRARGFAYWPWGIRNLFVPDFVVAPFVWVAAG